MPERETRGKPGHESEQRWSASSREELVQAVRAEIQTYYDLFPKEERERRAAQGYWDPPERVIRDKIEWQINHAPGGDIFGPEGRKRYSFWRPIGQAWDTLTYERYQPGSLEEERAGQSLSRYFEAYRKPHITLSGDQVRLLDTLADAVGLQRQPGQNEFTIPEKLRDYEQYQNSPEYQDRMNKFGYPGHWRKKP